MDDQFLPIRAVRMENRVALDFAAAMFILNVVLKIRWFFLFRYFLASLDNTGSTVYKNISLVYGRVLSGL